MIFKKILQWFHRKKIVIKFSEDGSPKICCKNCYRTDVIRSGHKLIANVELFPKKQKNQSKFKRFLHRFKKSFIVANAPVEADMRYLRKELKNVK